MAIDYPLSFQFANKTATATTETAFEARYSAQFDGATGQDLVQRVVAGFLADVTNAYLAQQATPAPTDPAVITVT